MPGSLYTNGRDLTVGAPLAAGGALYVTDGTDCGLASTVNLKYISPTYGDVSVFVTGTQAILNIAGTHRLAWQYGSSEPRFVLSGSGATVNYTNTTGTGYNSSLVLTSFGSGPQLGSGWFATAGTVNFYGNIYSPYENSSYRQYFQASPAATIRFVGSKPI